MWNNPDAVVLVAGGNSGESGAGSIGSPATNKNGVAVGASLNSEASWESFGISKGTDYWNEQSLAYFSSRGPTADGRVKPDVCGIGKSSQENQYITSPSTISYLSFDRVVHYRC
jgi:serine protease AprX